MGAWGPGPFENDDASDWLVELERASDLGPVRVALAAILTSDYVEAPEGSIAIAAAEVVAASRDHGSAIPEAVISWIQSNRLKATTGDVALAQAVVTRVRAADSELSELWVDAGDDLWSRAVDGLTVRLDEVSK